MELFWVTPTWTTLNTYTCRPSPLRSNTPQWYYFFLTIGSHTPLFYTSTGYTQYSLLTFSSNIRLVFKISIGSPQYSLSLYKFFQVFFQKSLFRLHSNIISKSFNRLHTLNRNRQ